MQNVQAFDVRKADDYSPPMFGTSPSIQHSPAEDRADSPVVAAYAVVRLKDSSLPNIEWMWKGEIDKIMARSRAAASGSSPWHTDYHMMARKTALRRACKTIPQCAETQSLHAAAIVDEQADANITQAFSHTPENLPDEVIDMGTAEPAHDPETGELTPEQEAAFEEAAKQ